MDLKRYIPILLLPFLLVAIFSVSGCGGGGPEGYVANRAKFSTRRWARYEMHQAKSFSYGESQVKEGLKVIGYEPSWLVYDSVYLRYPFELLSDLVIGEYDINPENGFARGDSSSIAYKKKDIVQMASAFNSQLNILLAVTDYGDYGYKRQFFSETAKKNLINSLDQALADISLYMGNTEGREHVGLLMDFVDIPWVLRRDYLDFYIRIKKALNDEEQGKSCLLYVVLPAEDRYKIYSDTAFSNGVQRVADGFILRTHQFNTDFGNLRRGPMLPMLHEDHLSIDSIVNYYTKKARIPANRLVMEIPYFSKVYVNDSIISPQRPLISLTECLNTVNTPRKIDSLSYCFYRELDSMKYFYDDTLSLEFKYNWMNQRGLGGVSLYGMGYGHGLDDTDMEEGFWELIAINFTEPAPRMLFAALGYLLCFIGGGIVLSVIFHWQVRFGLRAKRRSFWYYVLFMSFLITAVILLVLPVDQVSVTVKLIALVVLLVFPLGKAAIKYLTKVR